MARTPEELRAPGPAYPVQVHAIGQTEDAKLLASDGTDNGQFGNSVALSGDTALIAAYGAQSAYVFTRSGGIWTEQAKLLASDGAANDLFGYAVALSGDTALIGASNDDDKGMDSGSAYVFTRSGGIWTEQPKLLASDGAAGDHLGRSVALSGDTALIGADLDTDNGQNSGSAYVFTRSGGVWTEQAKLVPSDGAAQDRFGEAVALSGDTALIGAPGAGSGSAYVFTRSGGVWTEQAKLVPSGGQGGDYFGDAVALSGDSALIGAEADNDNGQYSGSAYVFTRSGGIWTQQAKLVPSDGAAGDAFGISVALSGDTALIGAAYDDDNGQYSGSAYVFTRSGGIFWMEHVKLVPSDGVPLGTFGLSVALSGSTALIGAPLDDDKGQYSGSAYQFVRGFPCAAAQDCTSGLCVDGVCCDSACGGGVTTDCQACSVAAGAAQNGSCAPLGAGTPCRILAGPCDVVETCDGVADTCPAEDVKVSAGTLCRAAAGDCDVAETCDGVSDACPADLKVAAGTECRSSAGDCDLPEACNGVTNDCPTDAKAAAGTECRAAAGDCDAAEMCDGTANDCPPDAVQPPGMVCRAVAGDCDVADTCDGASHACPDGKVSPGTECRPANGICDTPESCDGVSSACPPDVKAPAGTECRAKHAECDAPESCDGISNTCPPDVSVLDGGTDCHADGAPSEQGGCQCTVIRSAGSHSGGAALACLALGLLARRRRRVVYGLLAQRAPR